MSKTSFPTLAFTILSFGLWGLPLAAQQANDFQPRNVISANPIGLLTNTFNGEFERVISPTSTIGFGGSTSSFENETAVYPDPGPEPQAPLTGGTDPYGQPMRDWNDPTYMRPWTNIGTGPNRSMSMQISDTSTSTCSIDFTQAVTVPGPTELLSDGPLV